MIDRNFNTTSFYYTPAQRFKRIFFPLKLPEGWMFSKVKVSDYALSLTNLVGIKFYKVGASHRYDFIWIFRLSISRALLLSPSDACILFQTSRGRKTVMRHLKVSASLTNVGRLAVGASDFVNYPFCCRVRPCPTLVIKCRNVVVGLCATQLL